MEKTVVKHQVSSSNHLPTALVVGGAGFIGSYLSELLLNQNCQVFCLDNFETGKKENIQAFQKLENFKLIEHNLSKPLTKLELPQFDYIFHLASIESYLAHGKNYEKDLKSLLTNSIGTRNLLELAKEQKSKFLLGSSPYVFEALISSQKMAAYFGGQKEMESFYAQAEAKRFSESLVFEYFKNWNLDCRIVRILDVYGPGMPLNSSEEMSTLFRNIKEAKSLQVAGDGSRLVYPTFIADLAYGLLKAMFVQSSAGKIYTLAATKGVSFLSLAHTLIKAADLSTGVEFVAENEKQGQIEIQQLEKSQQELNCRPKIDLEEGIKKTLAWLDKVKTIEPLAPASQASKAENKKPPPKERAGKAKSKKVFKVAVILFFILIFLFSLPIFSFVYYFEKGIREFDNQKRLEAVESFSKSKKVLISFDWLFSAPFLKTKKDELLPILDVSTSILKADISRKEAEKHFFSLMDIIVKGEKGSPEEEMKNIKLYLDQTHQNLSLAETGFKKLKLETSFLSLDRLKIKLEDFNSQVFELRKKINLSRISLKILPEIFSFEAKKTYLVLLQNNLELRPTGGFIESYGLLTFEKGKLLDFVIEDVYTADNQLKGHVEPPAVITKYLGEKNWYLRDSNWQPDFPSSADKAEWFLLKEIERSADATIGLNLNFIQEILKALGPVEISQNNELITSSNLFERMMYYSEVDFAPGLKKENFLSQIIKSVYEKIKNSQDDDWLKLVEAVYKSLEEKQLLVSFHQPMVADFLAENIWSGAVRQQALDQNEIGLADYLMLVEANLGVNKTNYFIKRQAQHQVTILDGGELIETLNIIYENTSVSEGWPGGSYKNYLRLYTPYGTELVSVEAGKDKNSLKTLADSKIDESQEFGKQVFGFLVEVPAGQKQVIKVVYRPKAKLNLKKSSASYLFLWQKQPGINQEPISLEINFPQSIQPVKIAPTAKVSQYQVSFITNTLEDRVFLIEFQTAN